MRIPHAEYEPAPEGTRLAICSAIVDLGSQEVKYQGKPNGKRRQISMAFELVGVVNSNGNPFTVWRHGLTLSTAMKSAFLPILEALLGRLYDKNEELDLNDLAGRDCEITIEHKQGGDDGNMTFANIVEFELWPAGRRVPQAQGETFCFSLEPNEFDQRLWGLIPSKMQTKIEGSPEFQKIMDPDGVADEDTALRLAAKPSRRNGSPDDYPDANGYYPDGSRTVTQEEVEREQREAPLPTEPPYQPDPEDYFF